MRLFALVLLAACSTGGSPEPELEPEPEPEPPAEVTIALTTRDGVTLAADYAAAPSAGAPAVVLLHMIPPRFDRSSWPQDFRASLHARGWSVLNLDRRGAGASQGTAADAYQGELGKWDVAAAVDHLVAAGAGPIAVLGASNGTTSMVDYTAWASGEGARLPVALGYLSGGTYTENQTAVADLPPLPAAFYYPASEAAWPQAQRAHDPGGWRFVEYPGTAHGTALFGSDHAQQIRADLQDFLVAAFAD